MDRGGADQVLSAPVVTLGRTAVQVLPIVLRVRGAGDLAIRHTARTYAGGLAVAAMQPLEPWGVRPRRGSTAVQAANPTRKGLTMLLTANIFQPVIDVFETNRASR